jgi:2'-5' RNA ligase
VKATFALLADTETHDLVRKLAWDIHRKYRTGIEICRLPPHVSLKQPFDISDLTALEVYMDELASSIKPFEVSLPRLHLVKATISNLETGILWLDVEETETLRQLHNRINRELALRFGNTQAPFDGAGYHFHITVAMGGQPFDVYCAIYKEYSTTPIDLRYIVREIAMFVYDDNAGLDHGYVTHKILPVWERP